MNFINEFTLCYKWGHSVVDYCAEKDRKPSWRKRESENPGKGFHPFGLAFPLKHVRTTSPIQTSLQAEINGKGQWNC